MADRNLLTIFVPEGDEPDGGGAPMFGGAGIAGLPSSSVEQAIGEGLWHIVSGLDSEFFAFCEHGEPATDSLLQVAKFAQARNCDVVRGLTLVAGASGNIGIRGLDFLGASSTQTGTLRELPEFLLDLRLENLVIRKSLLLEVCSQAGSKSFSTQDLAARTLLAARCLGRVALVIAHQGDRSVREIWPRGQVEIGISPESASGSAHRFLEAAMCLHMSAGSAEQTELVAPKTAKAAATDRLEKLPPRLDAALSADEKFLVLAALPGEVYQLHNRLAAAPGQIIALRMLRELIQAKGKFESWLQSALACTNDIDIVELWRAMPMDACMLSCIKSGRPDLAVKAAQGDFDPSIIQLLDAQALEQALSSLYREHSLLNREWLSNRLNTLHRQVEVANATRMKLARPSRHSDASATQAPAIKLQVEKKLSLARKQLLRAKAENATLKRAGGADGQASNPQLEKKLSLARKQLLRARKENIALKGAALKVREELVRARKKGRKAAAAKIQQDIQIEQAAVSADGEAGDVGAKLANARKRNAKLERLASDVKSRLATAVNDIKHKDAEAAELRAVISALEAKLGTPTDGLA